MSLAPGERAKFLTVLDNQMSEELQPLYSIDVMFSKSSKGVKCGGISVFKLNMVDFKMPEKYDFTRIDPKVLREIEEAQRQASQQTEMMDRDPIFFKETEGRWIIWALDKAISIYDQVNGSARIAVKCPKLRIEQRRSSKQVASLRSDLRQLFPVAWDIDRLLSGDFTYDPWTKKIRRGAINAGMSKR